jgi:hypothetical protein
MGWVAPVANLVGTGISAYGQYRAGKDAGDVYEYNQQIAKYEAQYIKDRAAIEEAQLKRSLAKNISRKRAISGASGTVTDSGSNLDSLLQTVEEGELDAAILRYNAQIKSDAALSQSDLFGTQADQMYQAGILNTGTTLLNSASQYDWKKKSSYFRKPIPSTSYSGPALSFRQKRFGV